MTGLVTVGGPSFVDTGISWAGSLPQEQEPHASSSKASSNITEQATKEVQNPVQQTEKAEGGMVGEVSCLNFENYFCFIVSCFVFHTLTMPEAYSWLPASNYLHIDKPFVGNILTILDYSILPISRNVLYLEWVISLV